MAFSTRLPVIDSMKDLFGETAQGIYHWLSEPHIFAIVIAWVVTFIIVCSLIVRLGFRSTGVRAGTWAATFQSANYGGFTPAGSIFATLTRMAMSGTLAPMTAILAALLATMISFLVWGYGVGY